MSLEKAVLEGMEYKRFALRKHPPVPYVPKKDPVQEKVSAFKSNQSLKTTIGKTQTYVSASGTVVCVRPFSCM